MVKFNPIPFEGQTAILNRLKDEYTAHYFYTNVANMCDIQGYTAAAKYYRAEAAAELTHALKLQDFLNGYNIPFNLPTVPEMAIAATLHGVVEEALEIEVELANNYNADANEFEAIKPMYNLFLEMVEIQRVSVAESLTIVDQMNMATPGNKFETFTIQNQIFAE